MPTDPSIVQQPESDAASEANLAPAVSGDRTSKIWRVGRAAWALLGILGIAVLAVWVAGRLSLIVIPLILALFPATLLVPVANKLRSRGVPSSVAALVAMLLALVAIGGLIGSMVALVISEGPELVESASSGVEQIEQLLAADPFGLGIEGPTELLAAAREQLGAIGDYAGQAATAASAATEFLTGLLLLFVILFFYLKDGRRLTRGIVSVAPAGMRPRLARAADRAWDTLGSYFRGQMTVALVDAVTIGVGLLIIGVPLAVPLAVLIFFGALFPLVGALVTGGLAVLVGLADGGLVTALIVLALIVIVQQVEGNVLQPIIIGRATALHPLVVILAITAGAVLLGILGAFLAVPVAAIVARVIADGPDESGAQDERVAAGDGNAD
ncbi:MAG: AI-2E family transporter [Nitriliruptoraceae bacterium]